MSDIATRVKKIIVDKLGVEEAEVTNEASFTNDLGADSLDTVELIMEFEKEFNISVGCNAREQEVIPPNNNFLNIEVCDFSGVGIKEV